MGLRFAGHITEPAGVTAMYSQSNVLFSPSFCRVGSRPAESRRFLEVLINTEATLPDVNKVDLIVFRYGWMANYP